MAPQAINYLADFRKIIDGPKPVVVDFWATWCGPCKMIGPIFKKLAEKPEFAGVEFYTVDIDEQPNIMEEVQVSSMPTFLAFKDGNKIATSIGAVPANLLALINKAVEAASPIPEEASEKGDAPIEAKA
ncbi:putative thioredoxin [Armillaria luteobubalina]|uniref:Thioredoxin n=1 Tax=Armillaria luteobubalina TaxID=153913 RepID=A0AA39NZZ8_9AGAR|nr:putative thioredoxin [Armillaria luteobubalina]